MMTLEDLEEALEELFPNGFEIDTDSEGQIIIYTNLMEDEDGELVEFEEPDDEDTEYDDEDEEDPPEEED
jgi:hypothetical protein